MSNVYILYIKSTAATRLSEVSNVSFQFCVRLVYLELGTFEWWISGLRLDPLFYLISRLNYASFRLVINFKIN